MKKRLRNSYPSNALTSRLCLPSIDAEGLSEALEHMKNDCENCINLWREYAAATHTHIAIESKLEIARLQHDGPSFECLSLEALRASERRAACRERVVKHERDEHSEKPVLDSPTHRVVQPVDLN
jgi:hypothetical protein